MSHTADELKELTFRGPVRFYDGRKGMARQDYECVAEARFGYSWQRENRQDKGRQFYTVDGREVADLDEAARLLAVAPDPQSPREQERRELDEFKASPKIGSTRAQNDARMNADAGAFGTVRAWLRRAENAYHQGINLYAEVQRQAGQDFGSYRWLYEANHAAFETYRLVYLFEADRKADSGLVCAFGTRCRDCTILKSIVLKMEEARSNPKWPRDIDDADIDAAKAWTCISHVLSGGARPTDGSFVMSNRDREDAADEAERWAAIAGDPP